MNLSRKFQLPIDVQYTTGSYPQGSFHTHSRYEIYYLHSGSGHYLIGGHIHLLAPGDLILMHGMTLHAPKIDEHVPYVRTILHFDPSFVAELIRPPVTLNLLAPFRAHGNLRLRLTGTTKKQVESLLSELCELYQREDSLAYHRFLFTFQLLLVTMYETCDAQQAPPAIELDHPKARNAERIAAYIEAHYNEDIHLEHLERELHLDKHYMARLFKEVTGFTIFNYLYERRINQARIEFLLDPARSVTGTGYTVGFKNPSHFTRAFKKITGMTPEKFKQTLP